MTHIAVYGTLRKGYGNHRLIQQDPLYELRLQGYQMYTRNGGFPEVFPSEDPDESITVEVYKVDEAKLKSCDRLEGHPDWYRRTMVGNIEVQGTDTKEPLQMYIMQGEPSGTRIQSGDWAQYNKPNNL